MQIFEPLIVCGSVSLILFAIGFLGLVINRCYEVEQLRKENDILRNSLEMVKSIKGV